MNTTFINAFNELWYNVIIFIFFLESTNNSLKAWFSRQTSSRVSASPTKVTQYFNAM